MKAMIRNWMAITGFSGMLAVALGAFGAHGLRIWLPLQKMTIFETAVRYHFFHTFALFCTVILLKLFPHLQERLRWSARLFLAGLVLFSGGLYAGVLSDVRGFMYIVPVGGLSWIVAWFWLVVVFLRWGREGGSPAR